MYKAMVGALALALAMAPAAAHAKNDSKNPFASIPVTGTSSAGAFSGTMDIVGWTQDATGAVNAIGILNGSAGGQTVSNQVVTWPLALPGQAGPRAAATTQATCDVLNLVLGPLHLDLLGLVVDLNQVVLNVTAQSGAGNLLGNLLCAVTNLLNGAGLGGLGTLLTTLLNNLTTLLAGLGL